MIQNQPKKIKAYNQNLWIYARELASHFPNQSDRKSIKVYIFA